MPLQPLHAVDPNEIMRDKAPSGAGHGAAIKLGSPARGLWLAVFPSADDTVTKNLKTTNNCYVTEKVHPHKEAAKYVIKHRHGHVGAIDFWLAGVSDVRCLYRKVIKTAACSGHAPSN
ncbi:hypothetical protein EVAR_98562_1 [Eumeta japonica]|uniref:Uncharacterized protein n=1 Tax=Eumeta variegata TaxID=151549 RepID=A0A4C1YLG2_EUMVA|nr:hypothetical protein EVAR_98562_1 [Eumeta japonica]